MAPGKGVHSPGAMRPFGSEPVAVKAGGRIPYFRPTARYQTSWKMIWRSRSCESTYIGVWPSFSQLRAPDLQATCTTDHTAKDGTAFGCLAVPLPPRTSPPYPPRLDKTYASSVLLALPSSRSDPSDIGTPRPRTHLSAIPEGSWACIIPKIGLTSVRLACCKVGLDRPLIPTAVVADLFRSARVSRPRRSADRSGYR